MNFNFLEYVARVKWHLPKGEFLRMTLREWHAFWEVENGKEEDKEIFADDLW